MICLVLSRFLFGFSLDFCKGRISKHTLPIAPNRPEILPLRMSSVLTPVGGCVRMISWAKHVPSYPFNYLPRHQFCKLLLKLPTAMILTGSLLEIFSQAYDFVTVVHRSFDNTPCANMTGMFLGIGLVLRKAAGHFKRLYEATCGYTGPFKGPRKGTDVYIRLHTTIQGS